MSKTQNSFLKKLSIAGILASVLLTTIASTFSPVEKLGQAAGETATVNMGVTPITVSGNDYLDVSVCIKSTGGTYNLGNATTGFTYDPDLVTLQNESSTDNKQAIFQKGVFEDSTKGYSPSTLDRLGADMLSMDVKFGGGVGSLVTTSPSLIGKLRFKVDNASSLPNGFGWITVPSDFNAVYTTTGDLVTTQFASATSDDCNPVVSSSSSSVVSSVAPSSSSSSVAVSSSAVSSQSSQSSQVSSSVTSSQVSSVNSSSMMSSSAVSSSSQTVSQASSIVSSTPIISSQISSTLSSATSTSQAVSSVATSTVSSAANSTQTSSLNSNSSSSTTTALLANSVKKRIVNNTSVLDGEISLPKTELVAGENLKLNFTNIKSAEGNPLAYLSARITIITPENKQIVLLTQTDANGVIDLDIMPQKFSLFSRLVEAGTYTVLQGSLADLNNVAGQYSAVVQVNTVNGETITSAPIVWKVTAANGLANLARTGGDATYLIVIFALLAASIFYASKPFVAKANRLQ